MLKIDKGNNVKIIRKIKIKYLFFRSGFKSCLNSNQYIKYSLKKPIKNNGNKLGVCSISKGKPEKIIVYIPKKKKYDNSIGLL
tara:strand:+ start:111 stop:359 length:249 start_codon:yes stop_codon:yes gene_type:complete